MSGRRGGIFGALFCAALVACTPPSGRGLNHAALDNAIAQAIGGPSTCLLLADRASGKVVYRFGDEIACVRTLPQCDGPGLMNTGDALKLADRPGGRLASCPDSPDGSRSVGWAAGRVQSAHNRDLTYSAVMEGQNALPGHIMASRLYDAFAAAGL